MAQQHHSLVPAHHGSAALAEEHYGGEVVDEDEEKSIVLDDLDDLEDTDLQLYDARQVPSSASNVPLKSENKLINKSSPFPLSNEFYLYTPLGKLDKCMQCKAAFTSSHMLAMHIVKVHPKVSKNPKPILKHPNATDSIQILPSAEFQGPSASPFKRQRGRPPRGQFGANSGIPEATTAKRIKPNDTESSALIPINTTDSYNINNNNYMNNNNYLHSSHNRSYVGALSSTSNSTTTTPNHTIEALKKVPPPPSASVPIPISAPSLNSNSNTGPRNPTLSTNTNTNAIAISKGIDLEQLSKKIENLGMLRKVADQGLITEQQFQQKQEEFLQSVSFL